MLIILSLLLCIVLPAHGSAFQPSTLRPPRIAITLQSAGSIPGEFQRVTVDGDGPVAFATGSTATTGSGLHAVDIGDPEPVEIGPGLKGYGGMGLAVTHTGQPRVYVPTGPTHGLNSIDIVDDPDQRLSFQPRSTIATPGDPRGIAVVGDTAYVADGLAGLQIVDISNVVSPTLISTFPVGSWTYAEQVQIQGSVAYVAAVSKLLIINITDPAHPTLLAAYETDQNAEDVAVSGPIAYVAAGKGGLEIVNIRDATQPTRIGHVAIPGYTQTVHVLKSDPSIVVVGTDDLGDGRSQRAIWLFDLRDPTQPLQVGRYATRGNPVDIDSARAGHPAYHWERLVVAQTATGIGAESETGQLEVLHLVPAVLDTSVFLPIMPARP